MIKDPFSVSNKLYKLVLITCALIFLLFFYSKPLLSPNSYLYSNQGDGIKNYYTYAYHIKNNSSNFNFEGFNYPYGESFLYTDCHPLLAVTFKNLSQVFPILRTNQIGILNFLMLISFLIGAYVLFLLLKALKINHVLAIAASMAIMILSPQIFRIQGHFALSYSCCIPITLYLLFKFHSSDRPKRIGLLLAINFLFWLLIHAYLGMIAISIALAFLIVSSISKIINKKVNYTKLIKLLFASTIPIILFLLLTNVTDTHLNRTDNPYGFFEYYADFDTVFLPNHPPFKKLLFGLLPNFTQTWEGWSYIGLANILLLPIIGFNLIRYFRRKNKIEEVDHPFLIQLFLASSLVLLFSFGFPFRFGLNDLLESFPILKQFRAIGRFAWAFYFIVAIYGTYLLFHLSKNINSLILKTIIQLSLPCLMMIEGIPYHLETSKAIVKTANYFDAEQLPNYLTDAIENSESNKYQAIIPIPFYNIGSENYEKESNQEMYRQSMLLSYHSSVPLIGSYLTRPSLEESKNSLQLFAPSFYKKEIEKDLDPTKEFLICFNRGVTTMHEKSILERSQLVYSNETIELYSIRFEKLFKNTAKQEIDYFEKNKSSLVLKEPFYLSDSTGFFFYDSFEETSIPFSFRGNAAKSISKQEKNLIASFKSAQLNLQDEFEASIWLSRLSSNVGQDDLNHLQFVFEEIEGENKIQTLSFEVMSSPIIQENWTMAQLNFKLKSKTSRINFWLLGNHPNPKEIWADDFLIRNTSQNVYRLEKIDNSKTVELFKNNHQIKIDN